MKTLPKLTVTCENPFSQRTAEIALEMFLGDWTLMQDTLFIIDESWGYAYEVLLKREHPVTVVMTQSPTPEYWDDLLSLNPSALLAGPGQHSLEAAINTLKIAKPGQTIALVPQYNKLLTPTEAKVLHHLAWGKAIGR
jgi:hypothetical protein